MAAGPVDLSKSPYVALRPVPVDAVRLQDTFWQPRMAINRDVTLPAQLQHCEATGRIANFRRAAGKIGGEFQGIYAFNDSDVYKWAEAAAWSLATHPDAQLEADLDRVIQEIADAQCPDGYLNTYFMFDREPQRFTNLKDLHEIYCAGHLIQAAVAHHRATGKTTFLDVAIRLADHLDTVFWPEPGKRLGACGHEEAEMALVELYRETGEVRYLNLARFMIEARGRKPGLFGNGNYWQDHLPLREQTEMTGHAVRHLYLVCGAADVVAETGEETYQNALNALWNNFTTKRMYVTGGAGARYEGEAFGEDYELPNDRAYTETCAAIGSVMWNWRMLHITGDAKYADLMEHTLYNAVLPGLSLDGTQYFYQNPLADRGSHRRQEWFGCACCPPNIARLLASLPGYFYSIAEDGIYTHLYATGTATLPMPNGNTVTLEQQTGYPWDGTIEINVTENSGKAEYLYLRIPAWAHELIDYQWGWPIEVNGVPARIATEPGTYAKIPLGEGETFISLKLPMDVERLRSHPHVLNNRGRVALQRGPLIYCIEQADNVGTDVWDVLLTEDETALKPQFVPDLLNGVVVLRGQALAQRISEEYKWNTRLYTPYAPLDPSNVRPAEITAIPYYAWANRKPGPMLVWLPIEA
jgi:DUF1680 family protein